MWKNIIRSIAFFLIFALIFLGITPIFVPKNNYESAGIHEPEAKGFLAEPDNTLDVLFLGDSEVFSNFIPLRIWEQYGITSYLCSTANQVPYQSYSYLERALRTQSPKIVILEANALYREFSIADMLSYRLQEYFPLMRYHDRWKDLTAQDLTAPVSFTYLVRDKGYAYRTRSIPASTEGYMTPAEEAYPIAALSQWYFRKIQTLCRERGIRLIVVSAPSPANWDYYFHNGVVQLLEGQDIPYIDMNLMPGEIPIDWETESYDGGDHLNYSGACKTTDYMGKVLWESGLFEDKREWETYSGWNEALQSFRDAAASAK